MDTLRTLRFFDLFSGIGGFRIGLERLGWKCVGFCEIDKHSVQTYRANFDTMGEFYHSDATDIKTGEMPDFDVLVGGFPCQPFSAAGQRKGFEDSRGTLFFEIARLLRDRRPRAFILENVKGLTFKPMRKYLNTILGTLRELGYSLTWRVLNSANFVVPQHRERIYIAGCQDFSIPDNLLAAPLPKEEPTTLRLRDILQNGVPEKYYLKNPKLFREGKPAELEPGKRIRRLTPRECLRLQGFPDTFKIVVSDTQIYKQVGNAVTTTVVEAVGRVLDSFLRNPYARLEFETIRRRNRVRESVRRLSIGLSPHELIEFSENEIPTIVS